MTVLMMERGLGVLPGYETTTSEVLRVSRHILYFEENHKLVGQ
jgi:hypothetical protein